MARDPDQSFRIKYTALRFSIIFFPLMIYVALVWWRSGTFVLAVPFLAFAIVAALIPAVYVYLQLGKMMREIRSKKSTGDNGSVISEENGGGTGS